MVKFSTFDDFYLVDKTTYAQATPTSWEVGRKGSGFTIQLKTGRTFDISVPHLLRWVQSPHDRRVLMAARVHDQLLEDGFDRAFASSEFRRACRARGVSAHYAWFLFFATLLVTSFNVKGRSYI